MKSTIRIIPLPVNFAPLVVASLIALNGAAQAQTQVLGQVSADSVPPGASFYTSEQNWTNRFPPAPCNPCPDCPLYSTDDPLAFLVDASQLPPPLLSRTAPSTESLLGVGNALLTASAPRPAGYTSCDDYGKLVWFSSIKVTSGVTYVTLSNTAPGFDYTIWQAPTLGNPVWTPVQTLTATGFVTLPSPISAGAGNSHFFRASLASDPLGLGWTIPLDAPISSSAATADDCTVLVATANRLCALDLTQGNLKWQAALDNSDSGHLAPSPAVAADHSAVFVASHSGKVYAFNLANGAVLWSNQPGNAIYSSPAVSAADGTVYVVTLAGGGAVTSLLALNPENGATNWVFTPQDPGVGGNGGLADSSVAVGPDCTVYFVATGGDLYAVHPDGSLAWFFPFAAGSAPQSSPAFEAAGNILVGSADGYVYCLSPSGGLKWLFNTGDGSAMTSPAVGADSTIYAASASGNLFAITNGGLRWKYSAPATNYYGLPPSFVSSPAVNSDNVVFIGSADDTGTFINGLFVVTNGALKAFYPTAGKVLGSPAITRNAVVIGDSSGYLYKIPGASYLGGQAPWPEFRLDPRHTGAAPSPACTGGGAPFGFPNNPNMSPDGSWFSFYLTGSPGSVWFVFSSTNLADWATFGVGTVDPATGSALFTDYAVSGVPSRFYRARSGQTCSRIIGFIKQTMQAGTNLLANPLFQVNDPYYPQNTTQGWTALLGFWGLPMPPDQTEIRKWNGQAFDSVKWYESSVRWLPNGDLTLLPGQAFLVVNPSYQAVTIPFMGLVAPGMASNSIAPGANFISSVLPKAGRIHSDLGFNPNDGDKVLLWQTNHYATNQWSASTGWSGGEPSLQVGEGFLLLTSQSNAWLANSPACPVGFIVPSYPLWTDTGLTVTNGDIVSFPAAGTWDPDGLHPNVGPNGTGSSAPDGFLGNVPWAALIAFVGPDPYSDDQGINRWGDTSYFPRLGTNYYFVGSAGLFTNKLRAGKLWLGFNDDAITTSETGDNSGFVYGLLQITHRP